MIDDLAQQAGISIDSYTTVRVGMNVTAAIEYPEEAWAIMCRANPRLDNDMYSKIFQRSMPYFSRDLLNVDRDWEKVGQFCKHLGVLGPDDDQHALWTNEHVPDMGTPSVAPVTPGGIGVVPLEPPLMVQAVSAKQSRL